MGMRFSILRAAVLFFALPVCAFSATNVVNLSHYDMMRPDFATMKRQGIVGVIHEATYPPFVRDPKYLDHFLSVVSSAWAQASPAVRPSSGVLLVLDFEKNGHYPGGTMRADQAVAFVERIRSRTGVYPGIYSGEYHLAQVLNSARVTPAQKQTLTNCWLWVANYSKQPRATAPWNYWAMWQYCGDGKCGLPRSAYPIGIANIKRAELNIFRGSRNDLADFWQRRAWNPSGGAPRRESKLTAEL